jgi:chromosome segregation ATPase
LLGSICPWLTQAEHQDAIAQYQSTLSEQRDEVARVNAELEDLQNQLAARAHEARGMHDSLAAAERARAVAESRVLELAASNSARSSGEAALRAKIRELELDAGLKRHEAEDRARTQGELSLLQDELAEVCVCVCSVYVCVCVFVCQR